MTATAQVRQIGRAGSRTHTGARCPAAVAYFGVPPSDAGHIAQVVTRAVAPGPCCPPSLPQRFILQQAGVAFEVCCRGDAWAILGLSGGPAARQQAEAWLHKLVPDGETLCTTIQPVAQKDTPDVPELAALARQLGPRPMRQRAFTVGGFLRRPVARAVADRCGGSCGAGPRVVFACAPKGQLTYHPCGPAPAAPQQFAETSWCVGYAATHGPIAAQQCANAAIGIHPPGGPVARPTPATPICKDGRDMVSCSVRTGGGAPGSEAAAAGGPITYVNHVLQFPGGSIQDHAVQVRDFLAHQCGPDAPFTLYFTWAGQRVDVVRRGGGYLLNCGALSKVRYDRNWTPEESVEFFYANCGPKEAGTWSDYTKAERKVLYQTAVAQQPRARAGLVQRPSLPTTSTPPSGYTLPGMSPSAPPSSTGPVASTSCVWQGVNRQILWNHVPSGAEVHAWLVANCGQQ
jgi:hypothetical protein